MSGALQISISRRARAQIEEAAQWWVPNRPSAPGAIRQDLDRALALLVAHPDIGTRARLEKLKGVRRITLSRIRYHLYYRATDKTLEVLAVWHTSRGTRPTP